MLENLKTLQLPKTVDNLYSFSDDNIDSSKVNILLEFAHMHIEDCYSLGNSVSFQLYKKSIQSLKAKIETLIGQEVILYGTYDLRNSSISELLKTRIKLNS